VEITIRLLSTLALKAAVEQLAGRYEAESGTRIDADFAPTLGLLARLRGARPPIWSSSPVKGSTISRRRGASWLTARSTSRAPLSASP
jgi:hypothetical protein